MERDVRKIQNSKQFGLILINSLQSVVQGSKTCLLSENFIELGLNVGFFLIICETDQLIDETFCMDPAQRVNQNIELSCIITDKTISVLKPCSIKLPIKAPSVTIFICQGLSIPSPVLIENLPLNAEKYMCG